MWWSRQRVNILRFPVHGRCQSGYTAVVNHSFLCFAIRQWIECMSFNVDHSQTFPSKEENQGKIFCLSLSYPRRLEVSTHSRCSDYHHVKRAHNTYLRIMQLGCPHRTTEIESPRIYRPRDPATTATAAVMLQIGRRIYLFPGQITKSSYEGLSFSGVSVRTDAVIPRSTAGHSPLLLNHEEGRVNHGMAIETDTPLVQPMKQLVWRTP